MQLLNSTPVQERIIEHDSYIRISEGDTERHRFKAHPSHRKPLTLERNKNLLIVSPVIRYLQGKNTSCS